MNNDNENLKNVSAIARAKERLANENTEAAADSESGKAVTNIAEPDKAADSEGLEEKPDSAEPETKKGKKKRFSKKTIILYILLGLFIVAAIVCAVGLGVELYTGRQSIKYYSELTAEVEKHPRPLKTQSNMQQPATPVEPSSPSNSNPGQSGADIQSPAEDAWVPYVDFEALSERFPGIVAWINLPGTLLDYPVMQGTDNAYYLSHLPDKTNNRAGSVFLDYRNSPDFTDKNSLIYGHMSRVGEMFGALKNYRNQEFYDAHPYINLYTSEHDYEIVLIAGYLVDSGVETPPLTFKDDAAFTNYISNIKRRSVFRSDVTAGANDLLVCLCTCAYDFTNARLVIVGKLVEVGWSAPTTMTAQ